MLHNFVKYNVCLQTSADGKGAVVGRNAQWIENLLPDQALPRSYHGVCVFSEKIYYVDRQHTDQSQCTEQSLIVDRTHPVVTSGTLRCKSFIISLSATFDYKHKQMPILLKIASRQCHYSPSCETRSNHIGQQNRFSASILR